MSEGEIKLTLNKRETVGKGLNKFRADGQIPAVIHNHGKESIVVSGDALNIERAFKEAGKTHPIQVKVGSQEFLTLIRDVDFHPKKHHLRHVVFNAIRTDVKAESEVQVILEGEEIPAEKAGLIVVNTQDHVTIEALPKDLVDTLSVDATVLAEVGDKISVSDIKVPAGVEIKDDPDQTLAVVEMPRSQLAEEEAEAEESEGAEEAEAGESAESDSESKDKSE